MNPYVIIGLVVAWVASVVGVGYWQNHEGHSAERLAWESRENVELQTANAKILTLEEAARKSEAAHAVKLAEIDANHTKEIEDARLQKDRDVAAARAGRIIMRIPAPCQNPGGSSAPGAAASAGLGDGGATSELPRETAANLLGLADDADQVVRQLAACQAVVRADRVR